MHNTVPYAQGIRYQMMEVFDGVVNLYQTHYSEGQYAYTSGIWREDFNLAIGSIRDIKIHDHFIRDIL